MTPNEYMAEILEQQTLDEDGPELKALRAKRDEVEDVLREKLGSGPVIKYGGSKAKGTMVLVSYDLDLLCYFAHDEDEAGDTLEELYESVATILEDAGYKVDRRRSAIRVKSSDGIDFHVDVVPGRYVDDAQDDVFLHQNEGDKERLKTNPDVHIDHVKDSGCIDEIRLTKIWRERESLHVKTFVLELAVIEILAEVAGDLEDRIRELFEAFRDRIDEVTVCDPANGNNDLTSLFDETVRAELSDGAKRALKAIDAGNWEDVFGPVESAGKSSRKDALRRAVTTISVPTKPWSE
jgi:hypothetical protein